MRTAPVANADVQGPTLTNGHAHVWIFDVDVDAVVTRDDYAVLSHDEQTVARRFVRPHDSARYVRAHVALRRLLAVYTGRDQSQLQFARTSTGKPYLADSHLHFNLSHSGHCVAVGVCVGSAIGVDVEEIRTTPECRELARAYFAPPELAWMSAGSDDQHIARFYHLWTIKEALVKATGAGVSALAAATVTDEWQVEVYHRVAGYAAAAVVGRGVSVRWRTRSESTRPWQSFPTSSSD